jgi:predicted nucleic acid-binding protein
MKRIVLDASALISFFEDRSGSELVEKLVTESVSGKADLFMSVVNWGEAYYSTWRAHGQDAARQMAAEISQFPIQVMSADLELTKSAAELHAKYNLPYADCFAAASSKTWRAQLLTSDQDFAKVKSEIEILFL